MKPVEPIVPGMNLPVTMIGAEQKEYLPLPGYIVPKTGEVITRWQLTFRERLTLLYTGSLFLRVLTFNKSLQPLCPSVDSPFKR